MIFLFHFLAVLLSYFSFILDLQEEEEEEKEVLYQLIFCLLLIRRFPRFITTTVFPLSLSSSPPRQSKLTAAGPQQWRPVTEWPPTTAKGDKRQINLALSFQFHCYHRGNISCAIFLCVVLLVPVLERCSVRVGFS